ncbi:MAG: hypothetical protein HQL46_15630 [Gammaproteobacteria bacterium]|nr:hypothetical protein [Gammaproteobacteria bacterium]
MKDQKALTNLLIFSCFFMILFLKIILLVIVSIGGSILLADKLRYGLDQQLNEQKYDQEIARQKSLHSGSTLPEPIDNADYSVLKTETSEKVITVQEYTEDDCD